MRASLSLGLFAVVLSASASASAGDLASFGVGLQGQLGGAASTGLSPGDVLMPPSGFGPDTLAKAGPSFGGPYGGIGAFAEFRLLKMLGIEVDFTYATVTAKGDVPLGAAFPNPAGGSLPTVNVAFQQWQKQVAILGKFVLPTPLVSPFIAVGPEFMFPDGPTVTVSPAVTGITMKAHAGEYTALTINPGLELKLPIPKIDIRIPVSLRISYNLSSPDNPAFCGSLNGAQLDPKVPAGGNCRLQVSGTLTPSTQSLTIDYRTEWKYGIAAQVGFAVYF